MSLSRGSMYPKGIVDNIIDDYSKEEIISLLSYDQVKGLERKSNGNHKKKLYELEIFEFLKKINNPEK
tara:strand:+ start:4369 stop:4572 length:204 start_codon:yes stop_codon:yes gene_type:complete